MIRGSKQNCDVTQKKRRGVSKMSLLFHYFLDGYVG